jgi:two-component system response regulator LytT
MTILIIEDEQPAARRLQSLIHEIGVELPQSHYHVIGVCSSVKSAVDFLHHTTPDIILSDIQLSDGLSFEIFAQTDCRVPIIFIMMNMLLKHLRSIALIIFSNLLTKKIYKNH